MMNKRIKEISSQARDYARKYVAECKQYGYYMEHNELEVKFEEKFAELIIQECASVAFRLAPSDQSACDISTGIENHFGVEE